MAVELKSIRYISYKIYNVTSIKKRFGFRVVLTLEDMSERTVQHSGFESKNIAEKERNKIIAKLENRTYIVYTHIDVKTYMEYWYEFVLPKRLGAAGSFDVYKNCIFNHIIPRIGLLKLIKLQKGHVSKLYKEVYNYSKSVAKCVQTTLNCALDDAVSNNFIPQNVAKGETLPVEKSKGKSIKTIEEKQEEMLNSYHTLIIDERKTFSIENVAMLIKESKGTPIYMHVLFAALMGLRKSEINGIKYSDINYIHRKLKLEVQLGKKIGVKKEDVPPKTFTKQEVALKSKSSYRTLDIPDLVFDAILDQRKIYEANKKRRMNDKTNPFQDLNYVCCSSYGRPRSRGYIFKPFEELKAKTGVPDLPFHKLRTTYSTILAKNNFSMKAISQLLGHSSEIITFENYTDKNEIIYDCLTELEPIISKLIPEDKKTVVDCTDIETDVIMDEFYKKLCA
ncbi:MAG: site-specific integrase [Clostridia bacterium]|nr:site-specific integrase [Clostridia bacterium]